MWDTAIPEEGEFCEVQQVGHNQVDTHLGVLIRHVRCNEIPTGTSVPLFFLEHQLIITTIESPANDGQVLLLKSVNASRLLISHGTARSGHLTDIEKPKLFNKIILDCLWRKL